MTKILRFFFIKSRRADSRFTCQPSFVFLEYAEYTSCRRMWRLHVDGHEGATCTPCLVLRHNAGFIGRQGVSPPRAAQFFLCRLGQRFTNPSSNFSFSRVAGANRNLLLPCFDAKKGLIRAYVHKTDQALYEWNKSIPSFASKINKKRTK